MPYPRPKLSALNIQAAADITAALPPGAAPLLRFNNLGILGKVMARFVNGLYGRLDWIARQATPWTVDDPDYAAAWGALRGVNRKPSVAAHGSILAIGTAGTIIPAGTTFVRGDSLNFVTTAAAVIGSYNTPFPSDPGGGVFVGGVVLDDSTEAALCPVVASSPGAIGNTAAGAGFSLLSPIAGANTQATLLTPIIGGLDVETLEAFRARYLQRYAAPPQAGSRDDYPAWALTLPQVTRAWVRPGEAGSGAIYVYVMLDVQNAAGGGFPVGTDGVATQEARGPHATGDQLAVADVILPVQPAEALVYVCAPLAYPVNITISGMPLGKQPLVEPAIRALFAAEATPGGVYLSSGATAGVMPLQRVWSAIFAATNHAAFQITSPTSDITMATGRLSTLGILGFT